MTPRRRILLANITLEGRTGTETHLRDHALEFLRRGEAVMVYAPRLGPLAAEITAAGGEVHTDLAAFSAPPDIVQGNQHAPMLRALLHFRDAPGVLCCHDATYHNARPMAFPRILRHVAVDWNCRERVVRTLGLDPATVAIVPNSVDLARFRARPPLPERPRRALVFSHYAHEGNFLPALRSACVAAGLELSVAGAAMGQLSHHPEDLLARHDVVFGKARCALEAMAVGCHVVLCDYRGLGPTITPGNFEELRHWNFGARILTGAITPGTVATRLATYDPAISATLRDRVRADCGIESSADHWLQIYTETIHAFKTGVRPSRDQETAAARRYLCLTAFSRLRTAAAQRYRRWQRARR